MRSIDRVLILAVAVVGTFVPATASAQINFTKSGYYLSLGDSVAAGEGALPVTHGFAYQLYEQGAFGRLQTMDFGNIAIKGATADEVQLFQVPQALCIQAPRIEVAPTVITLTAGADDFLLLFATNGIPPNPQVALPALADAIAAKVERIIRSLVFGIPASVLPCAASGIPGITVLVSNYYSFDHPDPQIDFLLDLTLKAFGTSLQARVAQIRADIQAAGKTARVAVVDTFAAMEGRNGLLLIDKRNGFEGPFNFEVHPTNAGHTVIAAEFEKVWKSLQ